MHSLRFRFHHHEKSRGRNDKIGELCTKSKVVVNEQGDVVDATALPLDEEDAEGIVLSEEKFDQ